ncbi:MAG TPA: ATP-dependent helicase, partial [Nitrospirae bacterium]|nr:ATP-dependent helicase [Nitrospirota bacterium]
RANLEAIVKSQPQENYLEMSRGLLQNNDPENILAALLQHSFQDELDVGSYTEIADVVVDTKGKTRLFVTQGKKDGLTPKKLVSFIKDKCGMPNSRIGDIQVLDKFSFVTLPFHDAEILLSHFKKRKGPGPFITKAKKRSPR